LKWSGHIKNRADITNLESRLAVMQMGLATLDDLKGKQSDIISSLENQLTAEKHINSALQQEVVILRENNNKLQEKVQIYEGNFVPDQQERPAKSVANAISYLPDMDVDSLNRLLDFCTTSCQVDKLSTADKIEGVKQRTGCTPAQAADFVHAFPWGIKRWEIDKPVPWFSIGVSDLIDKALDFMPPLAPHIQRKLLAFCDSFKSRPNPGDDVIKAIQINTGCSLKEAANFVDAYPWGHGT
jgi:hypothetical protein